MNSLFTLQIYKNLAEMFQSGMTILKKRTFAA